MSTARMSLLAVVTIVLICALLSWCYSPTRPTIPDEINGFPTRKPFAVQTPTNLRHPPVPAAVARGLAAKGIAIAPPPDPYFLPPLPDDSPPLPPPPPITRFNKEGLPVTIVPTAPASLKKVP